MSRLFSPWTLNRLELPNRLIRSATWEGMADAQGFVADALLPLYRRLAKGGVGLIITGYAYIRPDGRGLPNQIGIWSDDHVPGLARLAAAIHEAGGKALVQIVHAGGQTTADLVGGSELIAPSAAPYPSHKALPRALAAEELPALAAAFAAAARRAMEAGFDGVQLHGAHGYLLNRFLSPASNRRTDAYGGSLPNRARFVVETIRAVRQAIGEAAALSMKLNGEDFEPGGLVLDDAVAAARLFAQAGLDHIEVSGGTPAAGANGAVRRGVDAPEKEAYFRRHAAAIKRAVPVPVGLVGGIRSFEIAEAIVSGGEADTASFARPLICEPELPARWAKGDRGPARCKSDGGCFPAGLKGGIRCVVYGEPAA
ncbi:MAG: NADH:flavin oxidoreductase [Myxococcales bacterium]|nr:MAG: NADH:flavin oxidoreductase [Myxococcales bacterium]